LGEKNFWEMTKMEFNDEHIKLEPLKAEGWILDMGGGGEGVIGQLMGSRTVAIDLWKRELEESSGDALKIVMDAKQMGFLDNTFECATAFFMLMYVPTVENRQQILAEAYRVLKPGGKLCIWDMECPEELGPEYELFVIRPVVTLPDREISTGYGVPVSHKINLAQIRGLAETVGFIVDTTGTPSEHTFSLVLRK
jgi:ubiquinone/menaquinone biosynthesis C-methylase UbiE